MSHKPVLLEKVLEYLNPKPGQKIIDATIDGGGHTAAILEKIGPTGMVLGIEQDEELFKKLKLQVSSFKFQNNLILVNDNFKNLKTICQKYDFTQIHGIIFDLGVSSWHFEHSGRGFSFHPPLPKADGGDEPLDMRFDKKQKLTAADILNTWKEENIEYILKEYAGEKFATKIAQTLVKVRKTKKINTTQELVEIISRSVPNFYKNRRLHFATRTFQALRIAVNQELENLEAALKQAIDILKSPSTGRSDSDESSDSMSSGQGGRLLVISFHSGEDKIVKEKFKDFGRLKLVRIITSKPIVPSREEIRLNPRARSAKLRIYEKT